MAIFDGSSNDQASVPVIVDAIREIEGLSMARCTYLVISSDEPAAGWQLQFQESRVPSIMIGIAAVVMQPSPEQERFEELDQIRHLYARIDATGHLTVEIEDLWLPARLLQAEKAEDPALRGRVYRVGAELFQLAYAYRESRLTLASFLSAAEGLADQVLASPIETETFAAWGQQQIDEAREIYPKSREQALDWRRDGP